MAESFGMIYGHRLCDSSLMNEPVHIRFVFMMMVAIADEEHVVDIPVPQLARKMNLSIEELSEALDRLSQPDDHSRTPTDGGRRLAKLDGVAWLVVNRDQYSLAANHRAARKAKSAQNKAHYQRRKAAASGTPWSDHPSESRSAEEEQTSLTEDSFTPAPFQSKKDSSSSSSVSLIQAESVVLSTSPSTSLSESLSVSETQSASSCSSSSPSSSLSSSPSREALPTDPRSEVFVAYDRVLTAFQTMFNTKVTEEHIKVVGTPIWLILEREGEASLMRQMEKHRGRGASGTYSVVNFVRDVYETYYTSYATPRTNRLMPPPPVLQTKSTRPF